MLPDPNDHSSNIVVGADMCVRMNERLRIGKERKLEAGVLVQHELVHELVGRMSRFPGFSRFSRF